MKRIDLLILIITSFLLSGCQMGYIIKNGYHQAQILAARTPNEEIIADPNVDEDINLSKR